MNLVDNSLWKPESFSFLCSSKSVVTPHSYKIDDHLLSVVSSPILSILVGLAVFIPIL